MLGSAADALASLIYPPSCAFSEEPLTEGELAPSVREELLVHAHEPRCVRCGSRVGPNIPTETDGCDLCRPEHYPFTRVIRLGRYEGVLAQATRRTKSISEHRLARVMADLFWESRSSELREMNADVVVPVPLHWWTELTRGYNPPAILAECWARRLGLPFLARAVIRTRRTTPQHYLSPTERRSNVRGAYAPRTPSTCAGMRVLLVDDILTTGSTCREVSRSLRAAGAREVVVAVLARGGDKRS